MSDTNEPTPASGEPNPEQDNPDFSPQWGLTAPRGGRTVVNRVLKDGASVPLFLGQTLINSLRDMGYNSTTSALCEHVDNAIQWGATEVRVYFRQAGKQPNQRIDVLVYDNGKGMAPHVLKVAMAFGGSMVFDNRSGIGRYGMGMKAAALNIAPSVDVYSWQELGAFYSMTLDVEKIGQDRSNMIELPDPQLSDTLPSDISEILTTPINVPKRGPAYQELLAAWRSTGEYVVSDTKRGAEYQDLLASDLEELAARLGASGTIVYMPNCDRLTYSTAKTLADHAVKDMARIYRRFIEKGVRLYVNNRRVEAFDPTFWMATARHTKVEGLTEKRSALIDSWPLQIPVSEGAKQTTEIRIRVFLLPVEAWSALPRETLKNKLHVFEDHAVSYMRNDREVEIGWEPKLKLKKHTTDVWFRVEIDFKGEADAAFGVAANKQGVRLQEYVAQKILDRLGDNATRMRKTVREKQQKAKSAGQGSKNSGAQRMASDAEAIQAIALPMPPADTVEQREVLDAHLRGLATSLREEGETEEEAFDRVKESKYLFGFTNQEYAPFYDTEYRFGKVILRVNSAHPFYQKVWQPLHNLAKKPTQAGETDDPEGIGTVADDALTALRGLQLLFLSLSRAQAQMLMADQNGDQAQLFRNLRKSWSDVLETQMLHS